MHPRPGVCWMLMLEPRRHAKGGGRAAPTSGLLTLLYQSSGCATRTVSQRRLKSAPIGTAKNKKESKALSFLKRVGTSRHHAEPGAMAEKSQRKRRASSFKRVSVVRRPCLHFLWSCDPSLENGSSV